MALRARVPGPSSALPAREIGAWEHRPPPQPHLDSERWTQILESHQQMKEAATDNTASSRLTVTTRDPPQEKYPHWGLLETPLAAARSRSPGSASFLSG